MVLSVVDALKWSAIVAVTLAVGQVRNGTAHRISCPGEPLKVIAKKSDVILSGHVLSPPAGVASGGDCVQMRVIHVYRGLSRVKGQLVKVRGLNHRETCGGRLPSGAVRIFLLKRLDRLGVFSHSGAPLRLSEADLRRLHAVLRGKASLLNQRSAG